MSRLGTFSLKAYPTTWFNDLATPAGWLPQDVVPLLGVVPPPPPPPPPPPRPPRPRPSGGGGGGGGISGPYCPPDWLLPYCPQYILPDECEDEDDECEDEADFALIHVTEGAAVRALATGIVESFIDDRGRTSLSLTTDDGTRHWYADLGKVEVKDGTRVRTGQVIARTRPGAPPLPAMAEPTTGEVFAPALSAPGTALLPPHDAEPPEPPPSKPAQVVFVEAPPEAAPPMAPPPPRPIPPPLRAYRLLPIPSPESAPTPPPAPQSITSSPIVRAVARLGFVAAILAALAWFDSRRLPPPKSKRPKKQAKKQAKERRKKRPKKRRR